MRKGRFSGLSDNSPRAADSLSLADLWLSDFLVSDGRETGPALDRLRSLAHSVPFLLVTHAFCAVALFLADRSWQVERLWPLVPLLIFDALLWLAIRKAVREPARPHIVVRLAAAYILSAAGLWTGVSLSVGGGGSILSDAALVTGMLVVVPAFFTVPALFTLSCGAAVAASALLFPAGPAVPVSTLIAASLVWLSLLRARDAHLSARQRLISDWEAHKAQRFVGHFEQSGRGWFWETNADGLITYISGRLSLQLGGDASELLGRRLADLLCVDEAAAAESTLDFHLSARFPFNDLSVCPTGNADICWAISGSPNFDDCGRFLGFRGIGTDLTEQQRSEAEVGRLAKYDSLTGLPNRAMMRATLDEALKNADRRKRGCALLLFDLDRFKEVNDTLGHPVGDALLREVAQRLISAIGNEGQVGRLGGDEFEAVLPGVEEEGRLASLAARLIEQVSAPYIIKGRKIVIGVSIGIAIGRPGKSWADALIKDADLALYAAKANGRGTFCFFEPEMHSQATDRQILLEDLRVALDRGQLTLVYQPMVNANTEEVVAFEALLRWAHPVRGPLAPDTFLPLAEESGLITMIGEWVLRTACAEAAKWPKHIRVAINLSPAQLVNAALPGAVMNALASSGIDPDRLELELREDVLLSSSAQTEEMLTMLRSLDVRTVLDNFGAGRSSLTTLGKASFDKIKISQVLMRGASAQGRRGRAIVRSLVGLADDLGMDVVAQGVETQDELTLARSLGCSQVQGFIFGRPMLADAMELTLESKSLSPDVRDFARPPRHSLIRKGHLDAGGGPVPVRLRNISAGGAMLESKQAIPPGERVKLDLSAGVVLPATISWCRDGRIGLEFAEGFDLQLLARTQDPTRKTRMLRPQYLDSETSPNSPWAGPKEKLSFKEVRRL